MRILHFTVHRENEISYAARLALMHKGSPQPPRKDEPVNQPQVKTEKPLAASRGRRVLEMHEVVKVSDWLRKPENIAGCTTYEQVRERISQAIAFDRPITAANMEGAMKACGVQLRQPVHPVDVQFALELIARIMLKNYDSGTSPGEIEALMEDLRTLFGGA